MSCCEVSADGQATGSIPSWAQTLIVGRVSGARSPQITNGQVLELADGALVVRGDLQWTGAEVRLRALNSGAAAVAGDPLTLEAGPGGATSGNGGTTNVLGGLPVDGNGGGVTLTARNGATITATDRNGGAVTSTAGNAVLAGSGGSVTATAGSGGATGTAGTVFINGGAGGSTSGTGGEIQAFAGNATDGNGGAARLRGGNAATITATNRNGGQAEITAGNGVLAGNGGNASIGGGATVTGIAGGVLLTAGSPTGAGTGGAVNLTAGSGGTTGTAGTITITAGAGGATSGNGGTTNVLGGLPVDGNGGGVSVSGRNAATTTAANRAGGAVNVTAGNATGTGAGGAISLTPGTSPTGTQGGIALLGPWQMNSIVSPAGLASGTTNDYNPTGQLFANVLRLDPDSALGSTLGGIVPGITAGRVLLLCNIGTAATAILTLAHDTGGTATNRFFCPNNVALAIRPNGAVLIWYDPTSTRWRVQEI